MVVGEGEPPSLALAFVYCDLRVPSCCWVCRDAVAQAEMGTLWKKCDQRRQNLVLDLGRIQPRSVRCDLRCVSVSGANGFEIRLHRRRCIWSRCDLVTAGSTNPTSLVRFLCLIPTA